MDYSSLAQLAKRLGVYDADGLIFEGDKGVVEHLAHEVAHCISLGWRPFLGMEGAVGLTLGLDHKDKGVKNEALVLASEAIILPVLGIHLREPRLTLRDAADVQGVPRAVFAAAWGKPPAVALAGKVLRYLGRRMKPRRRRENTGENNLLLTCRTWL